MNYKIAFVRSAGLSKDAPPNLSLGFFTRKTEKTLAKGRATATSSFSLMLNVA